MSDLSDFEARIERLRSRASIGPLAPELVAEVENVLAEGYALALRADARRHRLREHVDALVKDVDQPGVADEVRRLAAERRTVEQSAHHLRERLARLHPLLARAIVTRTSSA